MQTPPVILYNEESRGFGFDVTTTYSVTYRCDDREEAERIKGIITRERNNYIAGATKGPVQKTQTSILGWLAKFEPKIRERIREEGKICNEWVVIDAIRYWAKEDGYHLTNYDVTAIFGTPKKCLFPEYIHGEGSPGNEPIQTLLNRQLFFRGEKPRRITVEDKCYTKHVEYYTVDDLESSLDR